MWKIKILVDKENNRLNEFKKNYMLEEIIIVSYQSELVFISTYFYKLP